MKATAMQDAGAFVAKSLSLAQQIQSENANALTRHLQNSSSESSSRQFNAALFWAINGVWLVLVVAFVIWMWRFNGAHHIMAWAQNMANGGAEGDGDDGRRQDEETGEKTVPPEARRTQLRDYFREAKVHMVSH